MSDLTSHGAGMGIVPVFALREALVNGMQVLASDERSIREMVHRDDALLYSRTEEWEQDLLQAVRDLADPYSKRHAELLLAYPAPLESAHLPAVSIIEEGGGENPAELLTGDLVRESYNFVGPNQELWATTEIGGGYQSTVQIGAWAVQSETAMVLHAMCKWALLQQKDALSERGVHDLSIRTGGVEVDPQLRPRVAFVPMITATLSWLLRQSDRRKVPNRIVMLAPTFSS